MSWRFNTRTPRSGAVRWWIGAAGVVAGAAFAAYWLDPDHGRERRDRTAARAAAAVRDLRQALARRVRYVSLMASNRLPSRFGGTEQASASGGWPDEPPPDVDSEPATKHASG